MVVSNRFQLFVRSTSTVAVEALSTDSVGFLLEEAARKLGACYGDAWLSHGGKLLHLDGTLESFGIGKGATLHLAFRGRGGGCGGSKSPEEPAAPAKAASLDALSLLRSSLEEVQLLAVACVAQISCLLPRESSDSSLSLTTNP